MRYFEQGRGDSKHQTWVNKEANLGHSGIWEAFKQVRYFEQGRGDSKNQTWVKTEANLGHSGIWKVF